MFAVNLTDGTSLEEFRTAARRLIAAEAKPADVAWSIGESGDLFGGEAPPETAVKLSVPASYVELASAVLCQRDPAKLTLLYELLWRVQHGERHLLSIRTDPLVHRLRGMEKSVRHDTHKMTAFVRFREVQDADGERYVAWFEPQHLILRRVSPFFVNRFAQMRWAILTPDGAMTWDMHELTFGPGAPKSQAPAEDRLEDWWKTYYRSTFNPARANPTVMRQHMAKKYWHNMPETALIPDMLASAQSRAAAMIEAPALAPRAVPAPALPLDAAPAVAANLADLKAQATVCRRCPLHCHATQTVFGEGPERARLLVVGEQPGDQEDLAGRPFVGPAGQVFDRAIAQAGIARDGLYVTNAVKHFKFEPRGKRRIHQKPNNAEIEQCRFWLDRELVLVKPNLIVALGATAGRALLGRDVKVTKERGVTAAGPGGIPVLLTVHPSYILRLPPNAQRDEESRFVRDLALAARQIATITVAA